MKIVFFGLGSIGNKHARLLTRNFDHDLYAYRTKKEKTSIDIKEIKDLRDLDKIKPDIAFITNPTGKHLETSILCAKKGMDLFIEKPISNSKKGLKKLKNIVKKNNVATYVAYCLRFHPVIKFLKDHLKKNKPVHVTVKVSSFLPKWRKTNHLKSYSSSRKMGGGVILDLSHEIDYLYYLFGNVKKIKGNSGKASNVTIDSEDFADLLIEFDNGLCCNLHLNFLSRLNKREIILDFKTHTIVADLVDNTVTTIKDKKTVKKFEFSPDDMFIKQQKYFFENLKKKKMNDLNEATKVFDIIMKAKKVTNT